MSFSSIRSIGWSLRDYSKVNPEWIRDFLGRYKDALSSLSVREASKYKIFLQNTGFLTCPILIYTHGKQSTQWVNTIIKRRAALL